MVHDGRGLDGLAGGLGRGDGGAALAGREALVRHLPGFRLLGRLVDRERPALRRARRGQGNPRARARRDGRRQSQAQLGDGRVDRLRELGRARAAAHAQASQRVGRRRHRVRDVLGQMVRQDHGRRDLELGRRPAAPRQHAVEERLVLGRARRLPARAPGLEAPDPVELRRERRPRARRELVRRHAGEVHARVFELALLLRGGGGAVRLETPHELGRRQAHVGAAQRDGRAARRPLVDVVGGEGAPARLSPKIARVD
mmetsp:Transcript_9580/g.28784  ORF Transcript_9580/g.28784 Transcript_9580/m.28784 type:complete len:257 (-) Transcript_9580:75-845(-)